MAGKLRAILNGHKGAVSRLFSKFEATQEDDRNIDDVQSTEESLQRKLQTINDLHEKILDTLPDENVEEIEEEVLQQEEYMHGLQWKIQKVRSAIKVCQSNLNTNAQTGLSSGTAESRPPFSTNNQDRSSFHRLPKLELPNFHGNIMNWQAFWDSFESAIHCNSTLSSVQKFNYLKSALRAEALQTISGFSITNANYEKAVSLLHERYGKRDKIIQAYMIELLEIPAPTQTFASLRDFYDRTEIYIQGLDSLGQAEDTYGSLLVPVILQKLPEETRRNLRRVHGTSWELSDLMRCLLDEVNVLDSGSTVRNDVGSIPTATFLSQSDKRITERKTVKSPNKNLERTCVFCKGSHLSVDCRKVRELEQRMQIVKKDRLCFNCLGKHKVSDCKSRFKCRNCSRRHHTSLCTGKTTTDRQSAKTEVNSSVIHSAHTIPTGPVLLKTATSIVKSSTSSTSANILFDEGAQSSFITESLAQKLQIKPTGTEKLCLSGFGSKERRVRHLDTATDTVSMRRDGKYSNQSTDSTRNLSAVKDFP